MPLSSELISQFVKVTNDKKEDKKETTVYGTIVEHNGLKYIKIDGSDLLTPISSTSDAKNNERVTARIKDHTVMVNGNISSPSARTEDVKDNHDKIVEFYNVMAYKVTTDDLQSINATIENLKAKVAKFSSMTAIVADIETLKAKFASLDQVNANDVKAINAEIDRIQAKFGDFTDISTEDLSAMNADIATLKGYTADFTYVSAERLTAAVANIKKLFTEKLSAKDAQIKYATIDFSNIGKAAIEKFYATSGIIKDLVIGDTTITGKLVGVTITGDLIEAGTVKADKLVILGTDGLYYKLNTDGVSTTSKQTEYNSLNGSIITANSITAEKIDVKDLVAFDATIGGFNIADDSIYSGVKETVDNTTRGIYLDIDGQMAVGDASNFVKFYKDADGTYKLAISADQLMFGVEKKDVDTVIDEKVSNVEIGGRNLVRDSKIQNDVSEIGKNKLDPSKVIANKQIDPDDGTLIDSSLYYIVPIDCAGQDSLTISRMLNGTQSLVKGTYFYFFDSENNYIDYDTGAIVNVLENASYCYVRLLKSHAAETIQVEFSDSMTSFESFTQNLHYVLYDLSTNLVSGETYTATICVTPSEGVTGYDLYLSNGNKKQGTFAVNGTNEQIVSLTFIAQYETNMTPDNDRTYGQNRIYGILNNVTVDNSRFNWYKVEKGNKATDWTPAPEDVSSDISDVKDVTDSNEARLASAESKITQLENMISLLISSGNKSSILTQTENGWEFSIEQINTNIENVSDEVDKLQSSMGSTNDKLSMLEKTSDYIRIGTILDETGVERPYLELGESDSDFKVGVTNKDLKFINGGYVPTNVSEKEVNSDKVVIKNELETLGILWLKRGTTNVGLIRKE